MICSLLAYDADGNVIATLDHVVARDDQGHAIGLIDFAAHEAAGGHLTDVWQVEHAAGSGTWPEWLSMRAHDFRVEVGPDKRIAALVHKTSGHRRERAAIEAAIEQRMAATRADWEAHQPVGPNGTAVAAGDPPPTDIRDLVGGPDRPLVLDEEGRTVGRTVVSGTPAHLPVVKR